MLTGRLLSNLTAETIRANLNLASEDPCGTFFLMLAS